MDKIKTFFYEVRLELSRVSWPKGRELWGSTWIVIVVSLLLAIFIGFIDILFSRIAGVILK